MMLAQRKIVDKIPGAAMMSFLDGGRLFEQGGFQIEHVRCKRSNLRGELFKQMLIEGLHGDRQSRMWNPEESDSTFLARFPNECRVGEVGQPMMT